MSMNIYAKKGHKVVFTNTDNGFELDKAKAREFLKTGETYTIESTDVGGWITYVTLIEFPDQTFNSVMFEDF